MVIRLSSSFLRLTVMILLQCVRLGVTFIHCVVVVMCSDCHWCESANSCIHSAASAGLLQCSTSWFCHGCWRSRWTDFYLHPFRKLTPVRNQKHLHSTTWRWLLIEPAILALMSVFI